MKKIARFCLFFLIGFLLLFIVSRILMLSLRDPNNREFNHEDFYQLPQESVDVLFVGSSHCYCGFIPATLYEEYGISSYNLATSNQSMLANYLWVKEAYRTQQFQVLVLEAMSFPMSHGDVVNDIRSLSSMGLSSNYFELCKTYKKEGYKVLFPAFVFHKKWDRMVKENFMEDIYTDTSFMRGYVPIVSRAGAENTYEIVDENNTEVGYLKFPYADKIVEFCKEKGIQLIILKTPLARNDVNAWNSEYSNRLTLYCEENNIPFYDFNRESDAKLAGIIASEDVGADGRHANYYGAEKMTRFVGDLLTKEYGITSKEDSFDEIQIKYFHQYMDDVIARYSE